MTIDTWVSLAALAGVVLTLGGLMLGQTRSLRADLKADIARLEAKIDGNRAEGKGDSAALRSELKTDIAGLRDELKAEVAGLRDELKAEVAGLRDDLKADIGRLDDRVYALAAGLRPQLGQAPPSQAPRS